MPRLVRRQAIDSSLCFQVLEVTEEDRLWAAAVSRRNFRRRCPEHRQHLLAECRARFDELFTGRAARRLGTLLGPRKSLDLNVCLHNLAGREARALLPNRGLGTVPEAMNSLDPSKCLQNLPIQRTRAFMTRLDDIRTPLLRAGRAASENKRSKLLDAQQHRPQIR